MIGALTALKRVATAVLVTLAVAGCGGNPTAEQQQFRERANRICSHFSTLQDQVQFPSVDPIAPTTTHTARAEWAVALKQVAYLGSQEVRALRRLSAPERLRDRFGTMTRVKGAAYAALLAGADAAKRNRVAQIGPTVRAGRAKLARSDRLARALGLSRCG